MKVLSGLSIIFYKKYLQSYFMYAIIQLVFKTSERHRKGFIGKVCNKKPSESLGSMMTGT